MTALFSIDQVMAHIVGDYLVQSSWLASTKVSRPGRRGISAWACMIHVLTYGAVFWLWFHPSLGALGVIVGSHFLMDHFRVAVRMCWLKNLLDPDHASWEEAKENFGFSRGTPPWIAFWIMVLVDNVCHVTINALALRGL